MLIEENSIHCALLELGGSHDECMYSQLIAFKDRGMKVTLICTSEIRERNPHFEPLVNTWKIIHFSGKSLTDFLLMRRLNRYFLERGITHVVLNTAQGGHIRNLCLTASRKVEFIGIIHTLRKFEGSGTQRMIHWKVKKYFVLNNYFLSRITPPKGIQVEAFYPLRFPTYTKEVAKPNGEVWITVIGGIENRRKDLEGSISLMQQIEHLPIRFIFLGKSDPNKKDMVQFMERIKEAGLDEKVVVFNAFVPPDVMDAYVRKSDIIWPMIHPKTASAVEYFKNQIPGAMNVAFSYTIPLLVHRAYSKRWLDLTAAILYTRKDFQQQLLNALEQLDTYKEAMKRMAHLHPEVQEKRYIEFILKG